MNLHGLAINPYTMRLGMWFSQHTPLGVGDRLAWWAARALCQVKPAIFRIARANLLQVLGPGTDRQTLERTVRQVFYTTLRGSFDLYRALRLPREQVAASIEFSESARAMARSALNREEGSLLVFAHLGNFDMGGYALTPLASEMQLFTLPDPPAGFQLANELRRHFGIKVTPLSSAALRDAIRLLRRGGVVLLAADRPVSDLDDPVPFFGRPARVPSAHVRLALKTGAVVVVASCILSPETGRYTMYLEPPMEMIYTGNRTEEVELNMRRVLDVLEATIRRWVGQWQMYVPVWPELLES